MGQWARPIVPAFAPEEVAAVEEWVRGGGSLLLLADHMLFAGAAADLGCALGLEFSDGFALPASGQGGRRVFSRHDSSVAAHAITAGRSDSERLDSVTTFTGQGFRVVSGPAEPLLRLPQDIVLLESDTAWVSSDSTRRRTGPGWLQGAALQLGKGRVVVLGEAAMFSAQLAGAQRVPMGMDAPGAEQNPQLLLNTIRWLTRVLDP